MNSSSAPILLCLVGIIFLSFHNPIQGSSDFSSKVLDTTDMCYNPAAAKAEAVRLSLMTVCPLDVLFCKVEIFRVAGVFSGIARSCGGTFCVESCFQKGYGAESETCTFCCGGIPTNETTEEGEELNPNRTFGTPVACEMSQGNPDSGWRVPPQVLNILPLIMISMIFGHFFP